MQTNPVNQNPAPESGQAPGEVRFNTTIGQNALYATKAFMPGEVICDFSASSVFKQPNYLTVQIGDEEHIELYPQAIQFINHSCSPNVFFNTDIMKLVCLRPIQAGGEFTFFYPSTEWDMAQRFQCFCGSSNCLGEIKGAAWIDPEVLRNYTVTAYIKQKLSLRKKEERA